MPNQHQEEFFKEIADEIDSGQYFAEAKSWYLHKYIFPVVERSYLVLLLISFFLLWLYTRSVLNDTLPHYKNIPFFTSIDRPGEEFVFMKKLDAPGNPEVPNDPNPSIMNYLSSHYIIAQESYGFENQFSRLNKNLNLIRQYSLDNIIDTYNDKVDYRNPNSMLVKFRRNIIRDIIPINGETKLKRKLQDSNFENYVKNSFILIQNQDDIEKYNANSLAAQFMRTKINVNDNRYVAFMDFVSQETNIKRNNFTEELWTARIDFIYEPPRFYKTPPKEYTQLQGLTNIYVNNIQSDKEISEMNRTERQKFFENIKLDAKNDLAFKVVDYQVVKRK